jgi:hypothetical protein
MTWRSSVRHFGTGMPARIFLAFGCPVDDYVTRRLCLQQNETKHLTGEAEQSVTRGTKLTF